MLKKSLVATLILLYSACTIGLPLHFHYCRGELKHITLLVRMECHPQEQEHADRTCCQGQKSHCDTGLKTKDCCDDATQWVQDDLPAVCINTSKTVFQNAVDVAMAAPLGNVEIQTSGATDLHQEKPAWSGPPIYLAQCSLIYYG